MPREKYQLVQCLRIHSPASFFDDLGLKSPQCTLYVMVKDIENLLPGGSSSPTLSYIDTIDEFKFYTITEPDTFHFAEDNVLATVSYKPISESGDCYEATSFTAFAKRCGINIFNASLKHSKDGHLNCNRLIVHVIVEHDLVPYYQDKLHFEEVERGLIKRKDLQSLGFQEGFVAARDFHVSTMERLL